MNYLLMNKDDRLLAFQTENGPVGTVIKETKSYTVRRPHGWDGIKRWVDERKARMPKTVTLPEHPRYNLPTERMQRLNKIVEQNYSSIQNGYASSRPRTIAPNRRIDDIDMPEDTVQETPEDTF